MKVFIYVLIDPRNNSVRYIGKTDNINKRYREHRLRQHQSNRRSNWLNKLRSLDLKPTMQVIEECNESNWEEREQYWIRHYRELGCDLVNSTDGGEGTVGYKHTDETKNKIRSKAKLYTHMRGNKSKLGQKDSEATRRNKSNALKGRRPSEQTIKRSIEVNSIKMKGNKHSAKLTEEDVLTVLFLLLEGASVLDLSVFFGVCPSTISMIKSKRNWKHVELEAGAF